MIVPLKHFDWQLLRLLVRAEEAGEDHPTGRELRLSPTRVTKDGTFLDELVELGLIAAVGKPATPERGSQSEPPQFRTRYRLTDKGRQAAEYGEYDQPHIPADAPLSGLAAAVLGSRDGARASKKAKNR